MPPPAALLLLTFLLPLTATGCKNQNPVIYSLDPKIGTLGEPVTIIGSNFGNERGGSYVTIAGIQPTGSSYISWNERRIVLTVPEFGESGLVYVHVRGKKSNSAFFTNQAGLPVKAQTGNSDLRPRINSVKPQSGPIGGAITITGSGFGNSQDKSGVFFPRNAQTNISAPAEAIMPEFIEVSQTDFGYELWSEREIRVRVPDGAFTGNMEIRTPGGVSSPEYFTVSEKPGTKTFRDKRMYTLTTSVIINTGEAEALNSLFLWIPRPASSASQQNVEIIQSNPQPLIENLNGTSIFKLENLKVRTESQVNISWKVEVYRVETSVRHSSVRAENNSPVNSMYTQSTPLIPSDDPRIQNTAAGILGGERNHYLIAQKIYEWIINQGIIQEGRIEHDIFIALEANEADIYTAVLLYCAMLRSAGVPVLPVAGVLVNRNNTTVNHYWAEFWLDGFGWIPVDPAMGAGVVLSSPDMHPGQEPVSPAGFYFGNIDSRRVSFSRGFTNLSPMTQGGRIVSLNRSYSMQNLWEEAAGIGSYTSFWGDVIITGIYAH